MNAYFTFLFHPVPQTLCGLSTQVRVAEGRRDCEEWLSPGSVQCAAGTQSRGELLGNHIIRARAKAPRILWRAAMRIRGRVGQRDGD